MSFEDTENKAAIRRMWDLPIIAKWRTEIGRPLRYFGLTGPEIHDILDWKTYLDDKRTAVECVGRTAKQRSEASDTASRLVTNIMTSGLSSGFQLLRADVEDVILNGIDEYGMPPQLNDKGPTSTLHFLYDLVNLDFDGGIGYVDGNGRSKRLAALKKLFIRQELQSFLLVLTVNIRHKLGDEIEKYITDMRQRELNKDTCNTLDWYMERGKGEEDYRLKAVITTFINAIAEIHGFTCYSRPPISYVGHKKAHMLHFVFEIRRQQTNLRAFGSQSDHDLLNLPMIVSDGGKLAIAAKQHPSFDLNASEKLFAFLEDNARNCLFDRQDTGVMS